MFVYVCFVMALATRLQPCFPWLLRQTDDSSRGDFVVRRYTNRHFTNSTLCMPLLPGVSYRNIYAN